VDTARVAQSDPRTNPRYERGIDLFEVYADEVRFRQDLGVWLVPSQNDHTSVYEVTLSRPWCECADYGRHGHLQGFCCNRGGEELMLANMYFFIGFIMGPITGGIINGVCTG